MVEREEQQEMEEMRWKKWDRTEDEKKKCLVGFLIIINIIHGF